jgi:hypothetical protein
MPLKLICPLCAGECCQHYYQQVSAKTPARDYFQCQCCQLVFLDPGLRLSARQERAEYDLHENSADDKGYRQFLSRLQQPLQERIKPLAKGLDFGCGPGPVLSQMLSEDGYALSVYDIFYHDDPCVLTERYDFVTATEVVEHLFDAGKVLDQLWSLLNDQGVLALMTKLVIDQKAFSSWHYKNDPTHVCFFSRPTFTWLAEKWGAQVEYIGQDVIILTKR